MGCLNTIMGNKLIRKRYIETVFGESLILSSGKYIDKEMNKK